MYYLIKNKCKQSRKWGGGRKRKTIQSSTAHLLKQIIIANFSCLKNTLGQDKNQGKQLISVTKSAVGQADVCFMVL